MSSGNPAWAIIDGFTDYEISSLGRVRSRRTSKCQLLTGTVTNRGYVAFILRATKTGKPCRRLAHRLVAQAFLPPPEPEQTDVCHNDGNPSNNSVSNLRWDTHQANQMDMREHGTMQDGERCVTSVLTEAQVLEIRETVARDGRGASRRMCRMFGVSPAQVSRIVAGTRWGYLNEVAA